MTELSKIAAISGQGGLFRISTPLKNGVLLESLDEARTRIVAGAHSRVSVLSEISIYTLSADGSVPLAQVLQDLHSQYGENLPASPKSDAADLKKLLVSVLADADLDRVYVSDIKKLVAWYQILIRFAPEVFQAPAKEEAPGPEPETPKAEPAKPKKAATKKKAAPES